MNGPYSMCIYTYIHTYIHTCSIYNYTCMYVHVCVLESTWNSFLPSIYTSPLWKYQISYSIIKKWDWFFLGWFFLWMPHGNSDRLGHWPNRWPNERIEGERKWISTKYLPNLNENTTWSGNDILCPRWDLAPVADDFSRSVDVYTYRRIRVCVYVHTYIHINVHIYVHTCTYIYTYIHKHIHTYILTYTHTYIHTYMYSYIHTLHICKIIHTGANHTWMHTCIHTLCMHDAYIHSYIVHSHIHMHT